MLPQFKKDFLEKIKEDEMTQILEIWNNGHTAVSYQY